MPQLSAASNPHFLCLKIFSASNHARLTRVNPAPFFTKIVKSAFLPQKQKVHRERYGAPQVVRPLEKSLFRRHYSAKSDQGSRRYAVTGRQ